MLDAIACAWVGSRSRAIYRRIPLQGLQVSLYISLLTLRETSQGCSMDRCLSSISGTIPLLARGTPLGWVECFTHVALSNLHNMIHRYCVPSVNKKRINWVTTHRRKMIRTSWKCIVKTSPSTNLTKIIYFDQFYRRTISLASDTYVITLGVSSADVDFVYVKKMLQK